MAQVHSPAPASAHAQVASPLHSLVQALAILELQEAAREATLEVAWEAAATLEAGLLVVFLVCQVKLAQQE